MIKNVLNKIIQNEIIHVLCVCKNVFECITAAVLSFSKIIIQINWNGKHNKHRFNLVSNCPAFGTNDCLIVF